MPRTLRIKNFSVGQAKYPLCRQPGETTFVNGYGNRTLRSSHRGLTLHPGADVAALRWPGQAEAESFSQVRSKDHVSGQAKNECSARESRRRSARLNIRR